MEPKQKPRFQRRKTHDEDLYPPPQPPAQPLPQSLPHHAKPHDRRHLEPHPVEGKTSKGKEAETPPPHNPHLHIQEKNEGKIPGGVELRPTIDSQNLWFL